MESPLLWTRGVAARETLSYLDRRGINAEPALLGVRWSRRQPRGGSHKKIGINPMHYPLIKCPSGARQARQGHHLGADLHCEIAELLDSLHLQRLEDQRREFGVLLQIQPDLLDQLPGLFEVAVVGDADRDLGDDPIAALVLNGAQQAERHGVDRAAVVAQPDRADAEAFDSALVIAALDVLADPEGVVEQIEHAGDHVTHKGLRAKA